jgi:hypothetical protein
MAGSAGYVATRAHEPCLWVAISGRSQRGEMRDVEVGLQGSNGCLAERPNFLRKEILHVFLRQGYDGLFS